MSGEPGEPAGWWAVVPSWMTPAAGSAGMQAASGYGEARGCPNPSHALQEVSQTAATEKASSFRTWLARLTGPPREVAMSEIWKRASVILVGLFLMFSSVEARADDNNEKPKSLRGTYTFRLTPAVSFAPFLPT